MESSTAPKQLDDALCVSFESWTRQRKIVSIGTNAGSEKVPFQDWHHFKEAFAPEIVARAIHECGREVRTCIDPFGGSGTTALACQFLGVAPVTVEVNPYLADLIESKLHAYDADDLALDLSRVVRAISRRKGTLTRFASLPPTFIEDAGAIRWIFDAAIAKRISCHLEAIDELDRVHHRRLFRSLLGGMLVSVSNVVINGKGRRYRSNWEARKIQPRQVDQLFQARAERAISEVHEYRFRRHRGYSLLRGDCVQKIAKSPKADIAIFSPPYPNSFDYTDVYNIELWMLGYLEDQQNNRALRASTLCSHVQIKREFSPAPKGSRRLATAINKLRKAKADLWSPWIPEMVGAYFHDMHAVLTALHEKLNDRGEVWAVVGDSRYAGVRIPVAKVLADYAPLMGYRVIRLEPFRSMRASAQQGGQHELDETLIVLRKES
jgi:hypothetical protein